MKTKHLLLNRLVIAVLLISNLAWTSPSASMAQVEMPPLATILQDRQTGIGGCSSLLANCENQVEVSSDFTFTGWVYWDSNQASMAEMRIFDFGHDATHSMYLTPKSEDGTLRFAIISDGVEQTLNAAAPLSTDVWVHVAVTLGSSTGTLYVNGTVAATGSPMILDPSGVFGANYWLGKSQDMVDPYFNGLLDEVAFFDRTLSTAEIMQVYNNGWATMYSKLLALHLDDLPAFGGNEVGDASGQRHHGSLQTGNGDTANKARAGVLRNALALDGLDDYIALPANLGESPWIVIDTDAMSIERDGDGDRLAFKGIPFVTSEPSAGVVRFALLGDLALLDGETLVGIGSRAISLYVGGDVSVASGAVVDVSAVGTTPGPGGGAAGQAALGGAGGSATSAMGPYSPAGPGGARGYPVFCGFADGGSGQPGISGSGSYNGLSGSAGESGEGSSGGDGVQSPGGGGGVGDGGAAGVGGTGGAGKAGVWGGYGGSGGYFSGENGGAGSWGNNGDPGGNGTAGQDGGNGSGGMNTGSGALFSAGGGGGGGRSGGGGGGGGQGSSGTGGGGGGGGGATSCVEGGWGGNGGEGGGGGGAGTGGEGGASGAGGAGAGAIEIVALGWINVAGSFLTQGGDGSAIWTAGQPGGVGLGGNVGALGASGQSGSMGSGNGGTGGTGGTGGHGGYGGPGGSGGVGGGGAGGAVKLDAFQVDSTGARVEGSGGTGGDPGINDGGQGRFILDQTFASPFAGTLISVTLETYDYVPKEPNPFILGAPETPFLPFLIGGPDIYGRVEGVDAGDLSGLLGEVPTHAGLAILLLDQGLPGMPWDIPGYDTLLVINPSCRTQELPLLGIGQAGKLENLLERGLVRNPDFGGNGPVQINQLSAGEVYAIMVPVGVQYYNLGLLDDDDTIAQETFFSLPYGQARFVNTILACPQAQFSGCPASGKIPLSVSFIDQSVGDPTGWSWDFGDGSTSLEQNPVHIYTQPGIFTVSLTITNALSTDSVTVPGCVTTGVNKIFLPLSMRK